MIEANVATLIRQADNFLDNSLDLEVPVKLWC